MNKKGIITISIIFFTLIVIMGLMIFMGIVPSPFKTLEDEEIQEKKKIVSVEDLQDDCLYVWHNKERSNNTSVLETEHGEMFKLCPTGEINWKDNETIRHTVWFDTTNDADIPTLYYGDKLIYISGNNIPYEGIEWERFADYGYSIGVANLERDKSGHYRLINDSENGYDGSINPNSDAVQLKEFINISALFIDKLGSVEVRDEFVTDGGSLKGLDKDTKYVCEWYTGTYYQDFELTADTHVFCHLESFTTYEYEFLHSNYISITIPEWLNTGYYYVSGLGIFRYVSKSDIYKYTGNAYDTEINWNNPMILYDENGSLLYDPSTGFVSDMYKEMQNGDGGAEMYE